MKKTAFLLLFALVNLWNPVHAQDLKHFAAPLAEKDPEAYLSSISQTFPATPQEAAGTLYNLGHCLQYLNQEEKAVPVLINAKKLFEFCGLTNASKDLSLEIYKIVSSQEHYNVYSSNFLKEYFQYAKKSNSTERLAYSYNEFGLNALAVAEEDSIPNKARIDSVRTIFNTGLNYALKGKDPVIKCHIYNCMAAVEIHIDDYNKARQYLKSAYAYALETKNSYELFFNYYNTGISYYYEGDYANAIKWFKRAGITPLPKYRKKTLRVLYKKLMESYDAANDQPNRRKYQQLYQKLDAKINDEIQNIAIHETERKYSLEEKEKEISGLQAFKEKFYKNRIVFGVLLFFVFILALYSFIRWQKVDRHKRKLEKEKQQVQEEKQEIEQIHHKTVEELEKVKSIVTEEHITLKDNTKVYLNDLMYIKAEDHYLHLFINDGKKHFVRGKISQLIEELPPNFVKCQRSYIVNTNYITTYGRNFVVLKNKEEIPTSRNFKF